jgi:hypothetical protein
MVHEITIALVQSCCGKVSCLFREERRYRVLYRICGERICCTAKRRRKEMNPFLVSIIGTLLHMKRVCPQCKREQIIPLTQKYKTAKCKFWGAEMAPPPQDSGT